MLSTIRCGIAAALWLPTCLFWAAVLILLPRDGHSSVLGALLSTGPGLAVTVLAAGFGWIVVWLLVPVPDRLCAQLRDVGTDLRENSLTADSYLDAAWARPARVGVFLLFAGVTLGNAWIGDDLFLTLRTEDNFVSGLGLTWNTDERVQVFTHPLWLFVLAGPYALCGNAFVAAVVPSLITAWLAAYLLGFRLARTASSGLVVLAVLTVSKASVDYATSGLENSLTALLLAALCLLVFTVRRSAGSFLLICSVANFAVLNRMDTALLVVPLVCAAAWSSARDTVNPVPVRHLAKAAILGFLPFITWELFSLWYYGFAFPNTAYAKLHTGIPRSELIAQGLRYFANSLAWDPVTLLAIVSSAWPAGRQRSIAAGAGLVGIGLWCGYVVLIGGDFMSGRFFTPPLAAAAALWSRMTWSSPRAVAVAASVVVAFGILNPKSPLFTALGGSAPAREESGIADERAHYADRLGIRAVLAGAPVPFPRRTAAGPRELGVCDWCGERAYAAGPAVHFIDTLGLGDALLARTESLGSIGRPWRIGHFVRVIPGGYGATWKAGTNKLVDEEIARYAEELAAVTRGDLLSTARLRTIFRMNLGLSDGSLDGWLQDALSRRRRVLFSDVQPLRWGGQVGEECMIMGPSGLVADLGSTVHAPRLELALTCSQRYEITYIRSGQPVAAVALGPASCPGWSMVRYVIAVPRQAWEVGYDALGIRPIAPDQLGSVGSVVLGVR